MILESLLFKRVLVVNAANPDYNGRVGTIMAVRYSSSGASVSVTLDDPFERTLVPFTLPEIEVSSC